MQISSSLVAISLTAFSVTSGQQSSAYPIDCAILLCVAGGFPASAECAAAHAELIRRITPWPVEPPLQLWRCPMAGATTTPDIESGTETYDTRSYHGGIEVWQLSKHSIRNSGGVEVYKTALRHFYSDSGAFHRESALETGVPRWVDVQLEAQIGARMSDENGSFRGVLIRIQDYQGTPAYEWVAY